MKLTKKELKSILKECLLEIFQEQLKTPLSSMAKGSSPSAKADLTEVMSEVLMPRQPQQSQPAPVTNSALPVSNTTRIQNPGLQERVNNIVHSIASSGLAANDPTKADMFRAILEDTALTTLQNQHEINALTGVGGGIVDPSVSSATIASDQAQLKELAFGGDVSRWAKIALAKKS